MVGSSDPVDGQPVVQEASSYMTDREAEQLCQTFAEGLGSGLGYARIFEMLKRNDLAEKTVQRLHDAVLEQGDRLGEAFARYGLLDPRARKLVYVAEQQGKLPATFKQLGQMYGRRHARKKRCIFALVEPMIMIALGGIVLGNIVSADLVDLLRAGDTWSRFFEILLEAGIQTGLFGAACFFGAVAWLQMPVDFGLRALVSRVWMRVPLASKPRRLYAVSRFCRYLKQSIASGFDVHRSLELAAEASNHPRLLRHVDHARSRLKQGDSLTDALRATRALPQEVVEQIEIGEQSGRLQERLDFLTDRYDEWATKRFDRQLSVALWIIRYGIVIGVIVLAFYSVATLNLL